MQNYDKEIGLRELVLQELTEIVDDVVIFAEENPKQIFTEGNKYCILLTICLERCITFGMRDSGFFAKRSFFEFLSKGSLNAKDEYLQQDFNLVCQLLLDNSGKARAWIRKTINDNHLATSIYSLASDREFIKSWYEPYAIMSTNAINDLYKEIEKLEQLHFVFNTRDRLLDKDELFSMPPSQYRGVNDLKRLRIDDESDDNNDNNTTENKDSSETKKSKKKKKKMKKKDKLKKSKSRKVINLNNDNENDNNNNIQKNDNGNELDNNLNKSMSSNDKSDENNSNIKAIQKKKKSKKNKKKKKKKDKDDENNNIVENKENIIENNSNGSMDHKPSLKEWQKQHTNNIIPPKTIKSESHIVTPVNKSTENRQSLRPKSGSISERMQTRLQSIPININNNNNENGGSGSGEREDRAFRISSPSDYHQTFKWNDATKDNSSQIIAKLEENENKNKPLFPDPSEYEAKEQQFFEEYEQESDDINDKELDEFQQKLLADVPIDPNDDGELELSSDINTSDSQSDINTIPEQHQIDEQNINISQNKDNTKSIYYSPKDDNKSSTVGSSISTGTLSESKKEEILQKNDEYIQKKRSLNNNNNNNQNNNNQAQNNNNNVFAPECQTFIHHVSDNKTGIMSNDPTKNSLNIYLQSDNYFGDNNIMRDKRKQEQDKEAKKRLQREQDVMRGNDSSSIQKNLKQSGMSSGNKPLDNSGNKIVLPSTGIILDDVTSKTIEDFFILQDGKCFSCGDHLGSPQMSRQCYYTQRLFCALCMDGTVSSIIPSKLIHNLDTRKYPISSNSKKHLDSMYDVPAVPLSKIDLPSWYIPTDGSNVSMLKKPNEHTKTIPNQNEKYYKLIKLGEYLEILTYIKQYFYNNKECFNINTIVKRALGRRPYLLEAYASDKDSFGYFFKIIDEHHVKNKQNKNDDWDDINDNYSNIKSIHGGMKPNKYRLYGLISMRDMFELFNKDLLTTMQITQEKITNHLKGCEHCKKRSYGANVQFISKFAELIQ